MPGYRLQGATTVELTDAEANAASVSGGLWAQGGTPEDPVLADEYPGPQYGFGALRCSDDALNGDNVEHVYFPAGVTHVFCYALYVVPPPTSGTITIKKRVVDAPAGQAPSFKFDGSISYDPDGFTLADGQSKDFFRAGGQTWDVHENAVENYKLSSVDCTAQTASGVAGTSTTTVQDLTTSIHLVANEHVTCVYTNTYQPPVGGLTIAKITRGGVGHFRYTTAPAGGAAAHQSTATTATPGVPATAAPALSGLAPGRYTITEHSPASAKGHWRSVRVTCDGTKHRAGHPVQVTITPGTRPPARSSTRSSPPRRCRWRRSRSAEPGPRSSWSPPSTEPCSITRARRTPARPSRSTPPTTTARTRPGTSRSGATSCASRRRWALPTATGRWSRFAATAGSSRSAAASPRSP